MNTTDPDQVIPHDRPVPLPPGQGATTGTLLVRGQWMANWKITKVRDLAVLEVRPFAMIPSPTRDAIADEHSRLLEFAAPAAAHDVRFEALARGALPAYFAGDLR